MKTKEIMQYIGIGLSKPKWYKRSVWRKAEQIMDFLCEKFPNEVVRIEAYDGNREFKAKHFIPQKWAIAYKRFIGEKETITEAYEYMKVIGKQKGLSPNSSEVFKIYQKAF